MASPQSSELESQSELLLSQASVNLDTTGRGPQCLDEWNDNSMIFT
jgi:hypothetical protein